MAWPVERPVIRLQKNDDVLAGAVWQTQGWFILRNQWRRGAACLGCHHFGVTPYYDVKP